MRFEGYIFLRSAAHVGVISIEGVSDVSCDGRECSVEVIWVLDEDGETEVDFEFACGGCFEGAAVGGGLDAVEED